MCECLIRGYCSKYCSYCQQPYLAVALDQLPTEAKQGWAWSVPEWETYWENYVAAVRSSPSVHPGRSGGATRFAPPTPNFIGLYSNIAYWCTRLYRVQSTSGRTELCNMCGSRIKSGEQILNSWPWYSPTYAINSLTYDKYQLFFCVMNINSGTQKVGCTLNEVGYYCTFHCTLDWADFSWVMLIEIIHRLRFSGFV